MIVIPIQNPNLKNLNTLNPVIQKEWPMRDRDLIQSQTLMASLTGPDLKFHPLVLNALVALIAKSHVRPYLLRGR